LLARRFRTWESTKETPSAQKIVAKMGNIKGKIKPREKFLQKLRNREFSPEYPIIYHQATDTIMMRYLFFIPNIFLAKMYTFLFWKKFVNLNTDFFSTN
jgi:hypothetical protein